MSEQFICQQLFNPNDSIFYWTTEKSTNEIDFLLQAWDTRFVALCSSFNCGLPGDELQIDYKVNV
ncbi:hypothetical protein AGMMS50239_03150 [Bacteroidia bacterium]|nr:hypothetical protein AGMMS50239_03150 [Bacteroidia bacterium]